jgi:hypothetical protein
MSYRIIPILFAFCAASCWAGSAAEKTLREMTTEKPGSPYHWISESIEGGTGLERVLDGTPGPTVADGTLKQDILKSIGALEQKFGGSQLPELIEVRQLPRNEGEYREVWVVARGKRNIVYTVFLKSASQGGSDLHVQGPWD